MGGGGGVAAEGAAVGRGPAEAPPEAERRGGVPGGELRVGPLALQRGLHLGEEQRDVGVGGGEVSGSAAARQRREKGRRGGRRVVGPIGAKSSFHMAVNGSRMKNPTKCRIRNES